VIALRCAVLLSATLALACARERRASDDWPVTGAEPANTRYSGLTQIDRSNVARLRVAWVYHTGDQPSSHRGEIQATPIVVSGIMYTTTPALAVIALRADSGKLVWRFDPFEHHARESHVNRGVVYWAHADTARIFFTAGRRLYALDAYSGQPVSAFGDSGSLDLGVGLSRDVGDAYLVATSPGVIYKDVLIQGMRVGEGEGSAPGDVRAYDVRTGTVRWTFHTIPRPGELGYDSWPPDAWKTAGGANSWAGMSVDSARGIVYVPTGSATPDFYGGDRVGANLFANSLIALDANSGKRLWHFQTVHHDIWDRDLPAAPNLLSVRRGLRRVDAVAQITKSGFVFLLDRESGKPLFPIEERAVPASDLVGEQAWPTQPYPLKPAPFARQSMADTDVTRLSAQAHDSAMARYHRLLTGSLFTPPSREGTIVIPGFDGGGEWGGSAVDPESATLFVNASDVPWIAAMRESVRISASNASRSGADIYSTYCASCHGMDRRGRDPAPSLASVARRVPRSSAQLVLEHGRGFMPSFAALPDAERERVLEYLGYAPGVRAPANVATPRRAAPMSSRYEFVGYERWRDADGHPAIEPPWGTLSAIDLNTGEYLWRTPLGSFDSLTSRGMPITGTELYGGPIVTRGGLVFIAATQDARFRALDARTGALLWQATLPAPGFATPSTYAVRGKQYVVIAAGGGKLGAKSSDTYVAFALP
jgi:quinoprotein glucose dehydrogenase